MNSIWLTASRRLTRVSYRRLAFLSVTEITSDPQWQSALAPCHWLYGVCDFYSYGKIVGACLDLLTERAQVTERCLNGLPEKIASMARSLVGEVSRLNRAPERVGRRVGTRA